MDLLLLDCSHYQQAQEILHSWFEDVLEVVGSMIDVELVRTSGCDIESDHETELSLASDVNASGSEPGDASDW
jgi:hypothetical protein